MAASLLMLMSMVTDNDHTHPIEYLLSELVFLFAFYVTIIIIDTF